MSQVLVREHFDVTEKSGVSVNSDIQVIEITLECGELIFCLRS